MKDAKELIQLANSVSEGRVVLSDSVVRPLFTEVHKEWFSKAHGILPELINLTPSSSLLPDVYNPPLTVAEYREALVIDPAMYIRSLWKVCERYSCLTHAYPQAPHAALEMSPSARERSRAYLN